MLCEKKGAILKSFLSVNQGEISVRGVLKNYFLENQTRQYRSCINSLGTIKSGPKKKSSKQHTREEQKFLLDGASKQLITLR